MSDLDKASLICVEYLARRPGIRSRLTEQVNAGMRAQNLEADRNVGFTEDQEAGGPRVTDTTGEAAIRTDRARRLLAELDHAEGDLLTAANRLIGHPMTNFAHLAEVVVKHGYLIASAVKQSARVFDRALGEVLGRKRPEPGKAHDGLDGCQSCARLKLNRQPWWNEANYRGGKPTDLGGILKAKLKLCFGCYRFIVENDRLPTTDELRYREADQRGHWPRKYATTKRAS